MISIFLLAIPLSGFIHLATSQMMQMPFPGPSPMSFQGPIQLSGPMQFPGSMPFPGPVQFPGPMPRFMPPLSAAMPPPMPMPMPLPQPKLPVVVMPFYSKHNKVPPHRRRRKKKISKKKYYSSESSSSERDSGCSSSSDVEFRSGKTRRHSRGRNKQQVLTPVVSYVTKDGYVVYQKQVRSDKAKDWLRNEDRLSYRDDSPGMDGMTIHDLKKQISNKFSRNGDYD